MLGKFWILFISFTNLGALCLYFYDTSPSGDHLSIFLYHRIFRHVKEDQKERKFATKEPKLLKNTPAWNEKCTLAPVVALVINMSYVRVPFLFFSILNVFSWALRGLSTVWWQLQFTGGLWLTTCQWTWLFWKYSESFILVILISLTLRYF